MNRRHGGRSRTTNIMVPRYNIPTWVTTIMNPHLPHQRYDYMQLFITPIHLQLFLLLVSYFAVSFFSPGMDFEVMRGIENSTPKTHERRSSGGFGEEKCRCIWWPADRQRFISSSGNSQALDIPLSAFIAKQVAQK